MRIYTMTATFGKLEHQTLTLQPGLNIIEAPNEWGKSTWCAFIIAMLYGIDTKARTTQAALADKEHYAPWSGAPMEGRMDILWKGRKITIERRTRGRLIFGDFRAYETDTGLDVPELTAANCGMELLGVERSVFARAGFVKMTDMPVTQDDALRRRLNNLVTTGDESNAGEKLAQSLKELKNKCRYNRSGLLPQAEAERDKLEEQLRSLQDLNAQAQRIRERQKELEEKIAQLENHKVALNYQQAQEDAAHIHEAIAERDRIARQLEILEAECAQFPPEDKADHTRAELQKLHNESMSLQMEQQMLPSAPQRPDVPARYVNLTGQQAVEQAKKHTQEYTAEEKKTEKGKHCAIFGGVVLALAAAAIALGAVAREWIPALLGAAGAALGVVLLCVGLAKQKRGKARMRQLLEIYAPLPSERWIEDASAYDAQQQAYDNEMARYQEMSGHLQQQREELVARIQAVTCGKSVSECLNEWENVAQRWKALADMRRDHQRAQSQIETLQAVAKNVHVPEMPDKWTCSLSETDALISTAAFEQKQNQLRLGQFQGQADSLGQESVLIARLRQVRQRIDSLEETYAALELAQKALNTATSELQRRFAPRIAKRAQELFSRLTDGRYEKVMLAEDLSIHVSAQSEATLRSSQWRSDGTVDQLYLALRLAVAEELTPDAPLVLDDAMVRFDDNRLRTALHILTEMADNKQILLFTCQGRERKLQGEANERM